MSKVKVAFYWCASCGGCEEAVVDLDEALLPVLDAIEILFWPVAMDFKTKDVESLPDKGLAVSFINGGIRNSEQEEMVRMLRRKSKVVVAFGACAQSGGVPGLANQFEKEEILRSVYEQTPTDVNPEKTRPAEDSTVDNHELHLPEFFDGVRSLDQVIDVDYILPGCPPTPGLIEKAVTVLLSGSLPPKGSVLCSDVALCDECPLKDSKPVDLSITSFKRPHQIQIDPKKCLLAQGLACLGPATRSGCGALCVKGVMPCTGCFGPTSRVRDHGAKMLSFLTSNIAGKEEKDIDETLVGLPDPVGTFYRYSLPKSLLRKKHV